MKQPVPMDRDEPVAPEQAAMLRELFPSHVTLPKQSTRAENGAGRPTDLTNAIADKILMALRAGNYRNVAARWAHITPETFSRWMKRGKDGQEPYQAFWIQVEEAEAHFEIRCALAAASKVEQDPEIAIKLLERRHPSRWARATVIEKSSTNVTFDLGKALTLLEQRSQERRGIVSGPATRVIPHDPRGPRPVPVLVPSTEK